MGCDCRINTIESEYSCDSRQTEQESFFSKPKLSVEYEPNSQTAREFAPAESFETINGEKFYRKYLRVKVKNTGSAIATNCNATLRVISNNLSAPLVLEESVSADIRKGISNNKNIRAKTGERLVHTVFSDSRFTNHNILASISTLESLNSFDTLPRYILPTEKCEVEFSINCDENSWCKAKFLVHPNNDWQSLNMILLSQESNNCRRENLKAKLNTIVHRRKKKGEIS